MKKFIIIFIVGIFLIALVVGRCNDDVNEELEKEIELIQKNEQKQEKKETELYVPKELKKKRLDSIVLENPEKNRSYPEHLLVRLGYCTSYNREAKLPNWVAWHLTAEHTDGNIGRSNDYREDIDVPTPRANVEDYKGSTWSRGHMCPAGDNKWDYKAMSETFLLTNICPQHASLNSGLWNRIEQDCRRWAKKYGDIYIVCGPVLLNREHETIGNNKVVVPEAFFKVILRLNPQPAAIGFIIRNNEGKKKRDQFVNTIDQVERITGIDFFSALPDDIENEVEAYSNIKDWK